MDQETPAWFEARYLATDDPRAQSGFTGSAARWEADFVHVRLDMLELRDVRAFGRCVIVSSDGSFRRPDSPKAHPVVDVLRTRGWNVDGCYERDDEHAVEIAVAWTR